MKHNGGEQESGRRPQDILAEIDRTRNEMDYTLSAIERRLTPGQLVDQGIDYLRQSGANEFVQNLAGQVKYNPLPVSLVGIGIAWLMAAGKKQPDYESTSSSYGERAGQLRDQFGESAQGMRDRATAATQSAKERIGALGSSARDQVDRAKSGLDYMMREQPLALAAVGVAIGAVLAAMAPRTRQEDELMGDASERLKQQVKQAAQEATSTSPKADDSRPAGKPNVQAHPPKYGEAPTQKGPPKVGADLTPRGGDGTRRTS
ncbi:MAG: DUF3618 domain-containing protein [Burkholderiales bacterium]